MKIGQITAVSGLCLVLVSSISCNPFGKDEAEVTEQLVKVVRGDLMVTVSGSGNIEAANEINLTFGVGGRVDKIYVKEGDEVRKGEILAKLEAEALELAVTQTQVAVTRAQVAIAQAQLTVAQAKVNLANARIALEKTQETYTVADIRAAQAEVEVVKRDLDEVLRTWSKYEPGTPGYESYAKIVVQTRARLKTAEDKLEAMLSGFDTDEVAVKKLQVAAAEQSLKLAELSLGLEQQSLKLAEQSLKQAQKQLAEATITAPFDGVVASVSIDEKDTVTSVTEIIHLIDSSRMELNIEVDELDIPKVELGQKAVIEVDALPARPLEGKVSFISPLPTLGADVLAYNVKIDFAVVEDEGLRAGMSATADIIVAERSNVLLAPSRAINQDSQNNPVVEVMVEQHIEQRSVIIGISDGLRTEILDGLKEGEMVIERRTKARSSGAGFF